MSSGKAASNPSQAKPASQPAIESQSSHGGHGLAAEQITNAAISRPRRLDELLIRDIKGTNAAICLGGSPGRA